MVRWLNPNQGEEDDRSRRRRDAQDAFRERGLYTEEGQYAQPAWVMETGHRANIGLGDDGWYLSVHHPGDPTGTQMHAHLGHDDDSVYENAHRVMRSREAMGHMMDMYQRARLNNDPTGGDYEARRDPRRYYREFNSPRIWVN